MATIGSAMAKFMAANRPPTPEYGGKIDYTAEQARLVDPTGARNDPGMYASGMLQGMTPALQAQQQLLMPQFRQELGAALGSTFARSGRSGGLNVAADRVSSNMADRMGQYQNLLAQQAMGYSAQHAGNLMGDYRQGQAQLLDQRRFGFDRDAYQQELRMAQEAARQKRKGGFLGAVGGVLGGVAGSFLGPVGGAIGAKIGSKITGG